jgi:hypothetical protein
MLPGFLHLDLSRGLKADMITAAMSQFLSSPDSIRSAFDALDLHEISWEFIDNASLGIKGRLLHFYVAHHLVSKNSTQSFKEKHALSKSAPLWDGHKIPKAQARISISVKNSLLQACLRGDHISLEELKKPFLGPKAPLEIAGLSLEIINSLQGDIFVEHNLSGPDALWLLCHLVMLTALVAKLDPKFISASTVYLSSELSDGNSLPKSIHNPTWLRHILREIPLIEVKEQKEADVLAAAFIKTLVGHFGARGSSVIHAMGIGLSQSSKAFSECLWCEATLPDTMSEVGKSNKARASFLYEACGHVAATTDMPALLATMSLHGAQCSSYYLVYGERNSQAYLMRFLVNNDRQREALEAFLIKGNAQHVSLKLVEHHELQKRLVSVPLGSGNKISSYRFHEYIYYERCVRVEPLVEDLDLYVQKTDYSRDVARSDLLMAWKKWRGFIIEN